MEQGRNGIYLLQDNTSVDNLLGKWLKEDTKIESKSCSDELMDVDTNDVNDEEKEENLVSDHAEGPAAPQTPLEPEIGVMEIWNQCTAFYGIFKAASGREQGKEPHRKKFTREEFEAQKRFENWLDIFLVRSLTMKDEDWAEFMNKESENGSQMSDILRGSIIEYLMKEVRNLCLHFEAYKDFDPLKNYLFGKGYRTLKLLCRIESHGTKQNKSEDRSFQTKSETVASAMNEQFKTEVILEKKGTNDKEFLDLLLHLFEVSS